VADTQQLIDQAKCYECYGLSLEEGIELALLQAIVQNGLGPDTGNFRITESDDIRITEAADPRIIE
jgi:hypothetical protein